MKNYIVYFILLFGVLGCGTRRTELEASKTKVSASSASTTDIAIKNDLKSNVAVSATEQSKSVDKDIELIEEFGDDGKLIKRTYREKLRERESASKKDSSANLVDKTKVKANIEQKSNFDSLSKDKRKVVDADKTAATNFGGWGVICFGIVALCLLIYFVKK